MYYVLEWVEVLFWGTYFEWGIWNSNFEWNLTLGSNGEPKKFFCHICGKPYCSKQVLRKHMIKHNNEDSLVNKHMIEDPAEYKYKCSRHDNCKLYFKTAR